jgi:hypothetical protein
VVDAQGITCSTELIKQSELPTSPSGYNTDREGEQSSREGVVLGCFIRILIVSKDMYPYLVIRHVKGLTLSFHLHHWGPLGALSSTQQIGCASRRPYKHCEGFRRLSEVPLGANES